MHPYNANHQEQDSTHTIDVKPMQPNHPIYMNNLSE